MAAFDVKPLLAAYARENTQALHTLAERLPSVVEVNPQTGAVRLDKPTVRKLHQEILAEPAASAFSSMLEAAADGGMVSLKGEGAETAVPLVALVEIARRLGGLPKSVRDQLGISDAIVGAEVIRQLQRRSPGINPRMVAPEHALLFVNQPMPNGNPGGGGHGGGTGGGGGGGGTHPTGFPGVDCLINGQWGPLFDPGIVGWAFGFRVCLDHACAKQVEDLLIPGPVSFGKLLLAAAQGPQQIVLSLALMAYGGLLAVNIDAVVSPNGACIYCFWSIAVPLVIGPVWAGSR